MHKHSSSRAIVQETPCNLTPLGCFQALQNPLLPQKVEGLVFLQPLQSCSPISRRTTCFDAWDQRRSSQKLVMVISGMDDKDTLQVFWSFEPRRDPLFCCCVSDIWSLTTLFLLRGRTEHWTKSIPFLGWGISRPFCFILCASSKTAGPVVFVVFCHVIMRFLQKGFVFCPMNHPVTIAWHHLSACPHSHEDQLRLQPSTARSSLKTPKCGCAAILLRPQPSGAYYHWSSEYRVPVNYWQMSLIITVS